MNINRRGLPWRPSGAAWWTTAVLSLGMLPGAPQVVDAEPAPKPIRPPLFHTAPLDAWPILAITQWVGYDQIAPVQAQRREEDASKPPQGPAEPSRPLSSAKCKAALLHHWRRAMPEAKRIIEIIRPDLHRQLQQMRIDEYSTPGVLTVSTGEPLTPPYMMMRFDVKGAAPRVIHVHFHGAPTGNEPPIRRSTEWRKLAKHTLGKIFNHEPDGRPSERTTRHSTYLDWKPRWRGRALPKDFWMSFGAVKHQGAYDQIAWVQAWTAPSTPAQVRAAFNAITRYPVKCDHQRATMIVARNAAALAPDDIDDRARVWAEFEPIQPGKADQPLGKVLHEDKGALARQRSHGPVAAVWQVRIIKRAEGSPTVLGWVDPADGTLLRLSIVPVQPKR